MEQLRILLQFIRTRWFSRFPTEAAVHRHQQKKLKKQQEFLRRHCAFYRDCAQFPMIDKTVWMEQFDNINTVGLHRADAERFAMQCEQTREFGEKLQGVTVGLSSGTSGHRGVFLVSDRERVLWAGTMLAKALPKRRLLGTKIAFFMRADSKLYETVNSRAIQFRFFDMQQDMRCHLHALEAFAPTLLVAPPSCLLEIAKWNTKPRIRPLKVISIAEVLEPSDAAVIKAAFGVDVVHQVYQCTEGFLGATCACGTLHINEDVILMEKEWLDERRFIPIITDLERRAQPIVRYRLNDVLVVKNEPCKCGSPFLAIEKIEGRQDDCFVFSGNDGPVSVFPDFIRRCILFADGVGEYRVQQVSAGKIRVLADGLDDMAKQQITGAFRQLAAERGFQMPEIAFEPYAYRRERKLKRVENLCCM